MRSGSSPISPPARLSEPGLWQAMGLPLATAATRSSIGFALVDATGTLCFTTPAFNALIGVRSNDPGSTLASLLAHRYRIDLETASRSLQDRSASTHQLTGGREEQSVTLVLAERNDDERVVLAFATDTGTPMSIARNDSRIDRLTRLGNQRLLGDYLACWQLDRRESGGSLAVILLGLDRFGAINASLGRAAGDRLLLLVTDRLRQTARAEDTILRLGGDRFVLLHACNRDTDSADRIASRLLQSMSATYRLDGHAVELGLSIGIARLHEYTDSVDELMQQAELALNDAKAAGRRVCRHFNPLLERRSRERAEAIGSLRKAIDEHTLVLDTEPRLNARDQRLCATQLLPAWHHSRSGRLDWSALIRLAEQCELAPELGFHVLERAIRQDSDEHVPIALNLSPKMVESAELLDRIAELATTGDDSVRRLELGLDQADVSTATPAALSRLSALAQCGVALTLLGYGDKSAPLGLLDRLPFSRLCLTRDLSQLESDDPDRTLRRALLSMCRSLGLRSVAPEVNDTVMLETLLEDGVDEVYGTAMTRVALGSSRESLTAQTG